MQNGWWQIASCFILAGLYAAAVSPSGDTAYSMLSSAGLFDFAAYPNPSTGTFIIAGGNRVKKDYKVNILSGVTLFTSFFCPARF
jgi:hypothetical protein